MFLFCPSAGTKPRRRRMNLEPERDELPRGAGRKLDRNLGLKRPAGLAKLYIDFDSFFASAEQHLQPRLRGRPVGIVPIASEHTGLIAVSREAKALGLR